MGFFFPFFLSFSGGFWFVFFFFVFAVKKYLMICAMFVYCCTFDLIASDHGLMTGYSLSGFSVSVRDFPFTEWQREQHAQQPEAWQCALPGF